MSKKIYAAIRPISRRDPAYQLTDRRNRMENRNDGTAENVVQSEQHDGDVHAPVFNGNNNTYVSGDVHGGITQNVNAR
jgi:hypothetical protein